MIRAVLLPPSFCIPSFILCSKWIAGSEIDSALQSSIEIVNSGRPFIVTFNMKQSVCVHSLPCNRVLFSARTKSERNHDLDKTHVGRHTYASNTQNDWGAIYIYFCSCKERDGEEDKLLHGQRTRSKKYAEKERERRYVSVDKECSFESRGEGSEQIIILRPVVSLSCNTFSSTAAAAVVDHCSAAVRLLLPFLMMVMQPGNFTLPMC